MAATKATIVVCDDDDMIVQIVSQKLRSIGYVVHTTNNGAAVQAMVDDTGAALVILDAMMPKMNGLDVLKAIRAHPQTGAVPVLMLTARKDAGHISQALKDGVSDYLTKPFPLAELTRRVDILLRPTPKLGEGDDMYVL